MKKNISKKIIKEKIYSEDISINELIEMRILMDKTNFGKLDKEYADTKINNYIESLKKVEEIDKVYNKLKKANLDTSVCDKTIKRLEGINETDVSNLDKDDLEYFLYNTEDLFILFAIKANMHKYDFKTKDYEYINKVINDTIDLIYDIKQLKLIKQKMKRYNLDLSYINESIYNIKHNIYKPSKDPMLRGLEEQLESLPIEVLNAVKVENIKNKKDTTMIDKAIARKKAKIKEEKNKTSNNSIFGLIKNIFSIYKSNKYKNNKKDSNKNR